MKYIKALLAFIVLMIVAVCSAYTEFIVYMAEKLGVAGFFSKQFEKTGNYGGSKGYKKPWTHETKNSQTQMYRKYRHPKPHLC